MPSLSAVIPTRNRPADLCKAVESVRRQTRPADELIVIDQSPGSESATMVQAMFAGEQRTRLVYVHDATITGLVDAKRVAVSRAAGEIICFLEDDVVLEDDYLAQIEAGFREQPDMQGCSGVITNLPQSSPLYVTLHSVFFQGIFHDPRIRIFSQASRGVRELICCDVMSGGLSAWRRGVFAQVPFDTRNGLFMLEDIDFSTRIVKVFGHCLYVNPRARLAHYWSAVNRDMQAIRQRRKLSEGIMYYKKRRDWPGARRGVLMAMVWWLGDALLYSVRIRSVAPLAGYVRGVIDGIRNPLAS